MSLLASWCGVQTELQLGWYPAGLWYQTCWMGLVPQSPLGAILDRRWCGRWGRGGGLLLIRVLTYTQNTYG